MEPRPTNVAVLGSTGSIGVNALAVIEASRGRLRASALSAHSKTELALEQAIQHEPRWLVITDQNAAARQDWSALPEPTELPWKNWSVQRARDNNRHGPCLPWLPPQHPGRP
jgi:1-deoxy-D-xylulose 5-phosphate reductoisomerase